MKSHLLVTSRAFGGAIEDYRDRLADLQIEVKLPDRVQQIPERELMKIIGPFDAVIAGDDEFSASVLEEAKNLRLIVKWGVGVDGIDLVAARSRGIRVFNTPGVFAEEVADVVLGYLILLARRLHELDREIRAGGWPKIQGVSLQGKTLGIVGLGSIGRAVARRGAALGMQLLACEIAPLPAASARERGVRLTGLEEVLRSADFLSLNCNLSAANRPLLGRRELGLMKRGAYLINTARGKLIDEGALVDALRSRRLAGAALEVFCEEPLAAGSPLRHLESCILGSHNASNTTEAVARVNELVLETLLSELEVPGCLRDLTADRAPELRGEPGA